MAKFYQHLEPNELMGKVTKLRYVDDINEDDNIVYYYFVDGTKCNSEFIGEINDMAAVEKKKIMAEVIDPYKIQLECWYEDHKNIFLYFKLKLPE